MGRIKLSFLGQRVTLDMWHSLFTRLDNVVHCKHDHIMFLFVHRHRYHFIWMPQLEVSVCIREILCVCV